MKKAAVPSVLVAVVLLALGGIAEAQQPTKIPRIGWLGNLRFSEIPNRVEAFRQGLRELGYVEGKNIVIEWREGNNDQVPALVAELVRLNVDVIVSGALSLTRAAKAATSTIPIVMAQDPRSRGQWICRQPRAPWRKHYGTVHARPRAQRKKAGDSERGHPPDLTRCCLRDFNRPGPCAGVKRSRDRRTGAEGQASIPRRTNSGGFRDGI